MRISPRMSLVAACFWILLGVVSMDAGYNKILSLHTAGQPVSFGRYLILGFWILVIGFWIVLGCKSFKRLQAERKVS
jgi:hypothetical protein